MIRYGKIWSNLSGSLRDYVLGCAGRKYSPVFCRDCLKYTGVKTKNFVSSRPPICWNCGGKLVELKLFDQ